MERTYTASVIGAGMAGGLVAKALSGSPRFELRAVADLRQEARDKFCATYPGAAGFATAEAMLAEAPTDVLCIATYAPSHLPLTQAALALPHLKGLVVEKPLGDTTAAGRELLDAVKQRGLPMVVPHGLRVAPHAVEIVERVRNGAIGPLRSVEIQCADWDIINAGIHWMNYFLALADHQPIDHVLATCDTSLRTYRDGMQVETMAVTSAQTVDGVRVTMHTGDGLRTTVPDQPLVFHLLGRDGFIEFYGWAPRYRLLNQDHPAGQWFEVTGDGRSGHRRYVDELATQIDAGEPDYLIADSSLAALEICEAAYLSHRHRTCVQLPLATFQPPAPDDWQPGAPYTGTGGGRDGREPYTRPVRGIPAQA